MLKRNLSLLFVPLLFAFFGCKKQSLNSASQFYGYWKTSYGDTIQFSRQGNKNVITYDLTMNPSMPIRTTNEYTFDNNKFGIRDGMASVTGFRYINSFAWVSPNEEFQVQGVEWFFFLSSTSTVFTFTKIP
jgi:hypothetical protein